MFNQTVFRTVCLYSSNTKLTAYNLQDRLLPEVVNLAIMSLRMSARYFEEWLHRRAEGDNKVWLLCYCQYSFRFLASVYE